MDRVALPESPSFFARAIRWCADFLQTPGRLEQFLRYLFVSGLSLCVDLAAFALLISWTSIAAVPAGVLSAMVGLVMHYALSVSFVFVSKATNKSHRELLIAYALSGGMGFAITAVTIFMAVDVAGLPAFLGKGVAVCASFVCVYLVRAGYVFAPAENATAAASQPVNSSPRSA